MATFYIQLENKLLQISGDLTNENISKALGYVPVSPNVTNELSQRVDNITFDSLKDNPFLQDGSGELNIVDEAGNIIAKIDADGIHSVDFIAGEHRLSDKTDKTYVDEAIKNVEVDLTGYATEEYVNNVDFYNINNNPIVNNGDGKLLFVDENGYIGLQLEEDGLYVKDVIADGHTLSQKADKSEVPTSTSQLTNDSGYITKPVVDQAIASLVDSAPETLDTIGEIASALKNNADIVDVLNQSISDKQNTIEDLEAIRAGAAKGASALQEIPEEYAKKDDIPSLDGYATQAWVNSNNYATEEDLSSIEFNSLQNNPLVEDSNGEFNLVDDLGNVGFKVNQEGLFVKDVIAGNHMLSNKANISDINGKQDKLVSGANIKTINGESILGEGDLTVEGGADIIVTNKSDLDESYKDVPEGTKAVVVNKVNDILGVNLFDFLIGTMGGTEEVFTHPEEYTLRISSVDTNVELPISDTVDVSVTLPFKKEIKIEMGSDLASINRILVRDGYSELVWNKGVWMSWSYLLYNEIPVSQLLTLDDNAIAGLMAIAPALIVDFVGTKTITEYIKNGDNWEIWSKGKSVLDDQLIKWATFVSQNIPTKTSQLENDSNFITSDGLKTINGESIVGSGDITIGGGSSSGDKIVTLNGNYNLIITDMEPEKIYIVGMTLMTLTIESFADNGNKHQQYDIVFKTGAYSVPSLTLPDNVLWANGVIPEIEAETPYELSITCSKHGVTWNNIVYKAVLTPFKPVE